MPWDFAEGQPIYQQIIECFRFDIARGKYNAGEKLPSVRDLAADASVNPNTMQKALSELEQLGLVFSQRTSGRFITEDNNMLEQVRHELAAKYIAQLFESLGRLGLSSDEIVAAVQSAAKEVAANAPA